MEETYLKDFATQLMSKLPDVFSLKKEEIDYDTIVSLAGTYGWHQAFQMAAEKTNHSELIEMYEKMNWIESDSFDSYLITLMVCYGIIQIDQTNEDNNPYWDNIEEIAQRQREKGLQHYGCGLEDNPMPAPEVIEYLQEELIDALMYCEHLKAKLPSSSNSLLQ
ncbi:hypothetical protein [Phocaeicola sp.]|uniref:hypothetical protein n=1 Tax=Phocaeicola sp. TaxID=2773926 RepID=UPI00307C122E